MIHRSKKMGPECLGQLSLLDALIFFIILTIASSILIAGATTFGPDDSTQKNEWRLAYTDDILGVIMSCTCYRITYTDWELVDENGGVNADNIKLYSVTLYNQTFADLLSFDVMARNRISDLYDEMGGSMVSDVEHKLNQVTQSLETNIEDAINFQIARMLEGRNQFLLSVSFNNEKIELSSGVTQNDLDTEEVTTAQSTIGSDETGKGHIGFNLRVW